MLCRRCADPGRFVKPSPKFAGAEIYPADHGWCVKDGETYNEAAAEKAWSNLLATYKTALA
jgi:carboxymethylenebutenolidase